VCVCVPVIYGTQQYAGVGHTSLTFVRALSARDPLQARHTPSHARGALVRHADPTVRHFQHRQCRCIGHHFPNLHHVRERRGEGERGGERSRERKRQGEGGRKGRRDSVCEILEKEQESDGARE